MAAGDNYRRIDPHTDQLVFDSDGALVGVKSGASSSKEFRGQQPADAAAVHALVSPEGTVDALLALVHSGTLRPPFDLAARVASILAAQGYTFYAPLTHSVQPVLGSALPTHVRASAASVVDYAGRMHFAVSGEVRFRGARRVYNLVADSEAFTTSWTTGINTTNNAAPASRQCIGPRRSARTIARSSGASQMLTLGSAEYRPGPYAFSVGVEADSAVALNIRIERASDSATVAELTTTTTAGGMRRYAISGTITDTSNHRVSITCPTAGAATLIVNCAMLTYGDEVHEYVARGVAGAATPFEGALVDGCRYLPYRSGCTLGSDGIVTDVGPGAAIEDAALAGVFIESYQSVQRFHGSRDPGDVTYWTHTGVAPGSQDSCTLLGHNSLRQITEDTSTGLHRVSQAWKLSAASNRIVSCSFYIRRSDAPTWIVVGILPMGASPVESKVWVNTQTMAAGTISTGEAVESYVQPYITVEGDMLRVGLSAPNQTQAAAEVVSGFIGFADADGSESYTGTSRSMWVGAAQLEESDAPSSYVGDTAGSIATRASEDCEYARLDVLPAAGWSVTMSAASDADPYANNRSGWLYALYWYLDSANRGGLTLRRAQWAGGDADNRDDWPYDHYYGSGTDAEVHRVEYVATPRQRLRMAASMTRTANADGRMVYWAINGTASAANGGDQSGGVAIADTVISLRLGRNDTSYTSRLWKGTIRGLGIFGGNRVLTAAECAEWTA